MDSKWAERTPTKYAAVIAEMVAMGVNEAQATGIACALEMTFRARYDTAKPRQIAAELIWVWATGLAKAAETVYRELSKPVSVQAYVHDACTNCGMIAAIACPSTICAKCEIDPTRHNEFLEDK